MTFNFFNKKYSNNDNSEIEKAVILEFLRQVKHSYNLALGVTGASALITLLGVGLLYTNRVSEATLTASGGVLATITSVQFAKQSKEELQEIIEQLSEKV